jgi:hypothetical protein
MTKGLPMANFLYVDNSNIYIEGRHVAAVEAGLAPNLWAAQQANICHPSWRMDFGRLYEFAGGDRTGRAVLFGSRPPANDSLWEIAKGRGFEVVVYDRNAANKEKKVDVSLATEMLTDSFQRMSPAEDEMTLVSGDGDYVPVVENLRGRGFNVFVVFWSHAARELREAATKFVPLDAYLENLAVPKKSYI